jgi:general secretion pathway protein B
MSYILDALRKADAERERDPARGIHAQPLAAPVVAADAGRARRLWVAGGGVALLAIAALLQWSGAASPTAVPAPTRTAVIAQAAPPAPTLPVAMVVPAPVPATQVQPPAPPVAVPAPPAPVVAAKSPAAVPAAISPAAATAPAAAVAAMPVPAASAAAVPDRILNVTELPPDVARDLPRLAITGGVFSPNPAQRMLIVAGQVVSEGTELAPGLKLEEIRAKTAVLKFRGLRYSVGY